MKVCINPDCGYEDASSAVCVDCGSEMNPSDQFNPERLAEIRMDRARREDLKGEIGPEITPHRGMNLVKELVESGYCSVKIGE